jgi:hypothetical protein
MPDSRFEIGTSMGVKMLEMGIEFLTQIHACLAFESEWLSLTLFFGVVRMHI